MPKQATRLRLIHLLRVRANNPSTTSPPAINPATAAARGHTVSQPASPGVIP